LHFVVVVVVVVVAYFGVLAVRVGCMLRGKEWGVVMLLRDLQFACE